MVWMGKGCSCDEGERLGRETGTMIGWVLIVDAARRRHNGGDGAKSIGKTGSRKN